MSSTFSAKTGSSERFERSHTMGLLTVGLPDALDEAQRDADGLSAPGPVRHLARRLGEGEREDLGDGAGRVLRALRVPS